MCAGYDTVVGVSADEEEEPLHDDEPELPRGLSAGEWRRLQLARALVERNGDPPQVRHNRSVQGGCACVCGVCGLLTTGWVVAVGSAG